MTRFILEIRELTDCIYSQEMYDIVYLFLQKMAKNQLLICGLLLCFSCLLFYYVSNSYTITNFGLVHYEDMPLAILKNTHLNYSNDVRSNGDTIMYGSENRGFVFSVTTIEQQVGAAMNMLTLSKWAKYVGISPVEPFVIDSLFNWPPRWSESELSTTLRFRDYFNLDYWNNMCSKFNAAPLVSWETFLSRKTNNTIIVCFAVTGNCGPEEVFVDDEISGPCLTRLRTFEKANDYNIKQVLQTNIVRRLCIPMCKKIFDIDTFSNYVYGSFKPEETTVLVTKWFGIEHKRRLGIVETEYARTSKTVEMLQRSDRVIQDSRNYVK